MESFDEFLFHHRRTTLEQHSFKFVRVRELGLNVKQFRSFNGGQMIFTKRNSSNVFIQSSMYDSHRPNFRIRGIRNDHRGDVSNERFSYVLKIKKRRVLQVAILFHWKCNIVDSPIVHFQNLLKSRRDVCLDGILFDNHLRVDNQKALDFRVQLFGKSKSMEKTFKNLFETTVMPVKFHPLIMEKVSTLPGLSLRMFPELVFQENRDMIIVSGCFGKSLTYLFPIVSSLLCQRDRIQKVNMEWNPFPKVLICVPTKGMALSVFKEALVICHKTQLRVCCVFERSCTLNNADIVIGVHSLLAEKMRESEKVLTKTDSNHFFTNVQHLVMHEFDFLLDVFNYIDSDYLIGLLPRTRRNILIGVDATRAARVFAKSILEDYYHLIICQSPIDASLHRLFDVFSILEEERQSCMKILLCSKCDEDASFVVFCENQEETIALNDHFQSIPSIFLEEKKFYDYSEISHRLEGRKLKVVFCTADSVPNWFGIAGKNVVFVYYRIPKKFEFRVRFGQASDAKRFIFFALANCPRDSKIVFGDDMKSMSSGEGNLVVFWSFRNGKIIQGIK